MSLELRAILVLLAIGGLVFGTVRWYEHIVAKSYKQGVDAQAAVCIAAENKELRAAQDRLKAMTEKYEEAQNAAVEREKVLQATVFAAAAASDQLRDTIHKARGRMQSSNATCPALRLSGLAFSSVFEDCAGKYRGMAETADRHAADVRKLIDAWPR